jgi:hypothetical protein
MEMTAGEEAFCDLEGLASEIIRRAVCDGKLPERYSPDHYTLMVFVLLQAFRTPAAAAESVEFNEKMIRKLASLDRDVSAYADAITLEMNNSVRHSLRTAAECYPIATDLGTKLLINRSPVPFFTSDHPVIFYNQFMERRRKFGSSTGLAAKGLQLFLPLGPETCLVLFDVDVYRIGGRSQTNVGVPAALDDARWLNALQVANAQSQLFFSGAATESEIRRTVDRASPWRFNGRTQITSHPGNIQPDGTESTFIHTSKKDLRVGLRLSCIGEAPSAQSYRLGDRVVHNRNPYLCKLHDEFVKRVDAKEYRPSQFGEFLRTKQSS